MLGDLTNAQIEDVLRSEVIGRIGCHADGSTYVVPITFAYDGECVYAHSANGRKVRMMRTNPSVCFEVEQIDDLANWRTVLAWGTFEELFGSDASAAMKFVSDRLRPLMTSSTAQPAVALDAEGVPLGGHLVDTAANTPVMYRIQLRDKTGRFEKRRNGVGSSTSAACIQ